jgi:cytidylate kinase
MSQKRLKRDAALDFVKKGELARKRYLKANFRADIDDNMLYDLVINTARIPHDQVAQLIGDALLNWAKPGK